MDQELLLAAARAVVYVLEYAWTHGQCLPVAGGVL